MNTNMTSKYVGRWATLFPLLLAVACSSGPRGGGPADGMLGPLSLEPPPVYALLGYRSDLDLTSEQVAALDSIAEEGQDESAPLLEELQDRSGRQREMASMDDGEEDPLVAEIRASHRRTSEAVAEVLTEEQEAEVCRLFDRSRSPDRAGAQRRPQPPEASEDSLRGESRSTRTWTWCGREAGDARSSSRTP